MIKLVSLEPNEDFSEVLTCEGIKNMADALTVQGNVSEKLFGRQRHYTT